MVRVILAIAIFCLPLASHAQSTREIIVSIYFPGVDEEIQTARVFSKFRFAVKSRPGEEVPIPDVSRIIEAQRYFLLFIPLEHLTVQKFKFQDVPDNARKFFATGCLQGNSSEKSYFIPVQSLKIKGNYVKSKSATVPDLEKFSYESIEVVLNRELRFNNAMFTLRGIDFLLETLESLKRSKTLNDDSESSVRTSGMDICRSAPREDINTIFDRLAKDEIRPFLFDNASFLDEANSAFVLKLLDVLKDHDDSIDRSAFTELHTQYLNRILNDTANRRINNEPLHQRVIKRLKRIYNANISSAWPFADETIAATVDQERHDDCLLISRDILEKIRSMEQPMDTSTFERLGTFETNYRLSLIEATRCAALVGAANHTFDYDLKKYTDAVLSAPGGESFVRAFLYAFERGEELEIVDRESEDRSGLSDYYSVFQESY